MSKQRSHVNFNWHFIPSFGFSFDANHVPDDGSQADHIFWERYVHIGWVECLWYSQFENFREEICIRAWTTNYGHPPAFIWWLFISPWLRLNCDSGKWFVWPVNSSKNPFDKSFWRIN